jgi:AAA ATPase domain
LVGRRGECAVLDQLLRVVRSGRSSVLVLRGEPGIGKTALLGYLLERASGCRIARAAGVQSEMELAFAGLHQLCAPLLDRLDRLPGPQRDALATAFGLSAGAAPNRFLVGLAALSLLSEAAEVQPLVCAVDDAHWLDRASAQALGFVARRLQAESVGLVVTTREPGEDFAGLPELVIEGLRDAEARALLHSVIRGRLDELVQERIVAETGGNPLALLELPRGLTPAELAGGFGLPDAPALSGRIEDSFRRRLEDLPAETRRLLVIAAAEPTGEPLLVWKAAGRLGIGAGSAAPQRKRAWSSSAPEYGFVIRWHVRRCIGRRRRETCRTHTGHWQKLLIPLSIRIAAPGTERRRRQDPARMSPPSWSARPTARRLAAASRPRPHSWSGQPS